MACNEKNPLQREGTSVLTRVLKALSTSFVKPDERQAADILLFMRRYSTYLNYYDAANNPAGDWESFMKMDISVTLAVLMRLDSRKCVDYKKLLYKKIKLSGTDAEAKKEFKYVFDLHFSLLKIVTGQYHLLPDTYEFRQEIENIIKTKLLQSAVNLKQLFDDFNTNSLVDTGTDIDSAAPVNTQPGIGFALADLGPEWTLPAPVPGLTVPTTLPAIKQKIIYIINHNFFNAQIESLLKAIATLAEKSAVLFEKTLEDYPSHTPHYALVLAFVKLFGIAQNELNNYTKRHLDFYYKEVLQLTNKKAEADKAHLVFELQKPVPKLLLTHGTLFKGGKDSITGKELSYTLLTDVVLNKAVVEKVQSIQFLNRTKEVLAFAPTAVSEDGQGAKLVSADKSWFTFGNPETIKEASTGFGIASNLLYLNEGFRKISLTVNFASGTTTFADATGIPRSGIFTGMLTGKKGWHTVDMPVLGNTSGDQLTFTLTLSPDDPPIIPYDEAIHKEAIETDLPVLKVYLNQTSPFAYPYRSLSNDRINTVSVSVEVAGVRDLQLSNDVSAIDASKPFKPYGEFPDPGASFYIGSKELFQKSLTEIQFVFGDDIFYDGTLGYLYRGSWVNINNSLVSPHIFTLNSNYIPAAKDFTANEPLALTTLTGFIRLSLQSSAFSKSTYLTSVQTQINSTSIIKDGENFKFSTGPIASPGELTLSSFSINYKATAVIPLNTVNSSSNNHFFHLTPLGYYEVAFNSLIPSQKISLVQEIANNGELFIGLNNTEPEEVVNLLFQVSEGSSNPLKNEEQLTWHYLDAGNNWVVFNSQDIIDRTHNLTQSGIVTVTLPLTISNQCTALQKGLYWIKTAVKQNPDAVCKTILIQSQAAEVALLQDESKRIEFSHTLPAGTISKLITSEAAIKSIAQPFNSFGGRTREIDEHFYVRVSERLRHKQRAITIWDYEHIVLEQFPQISKVRCINHAGFYKGADDTEVFCENYPGHVTIITIPDFRNKSGINPLKPYTAIGTLVNIDQYLHKVISPFVKLHVKNPQFEEVQFEFGVSFYEQLDDAFYRQLLSKEIEKFLTPWAFDTANEISFGGKINKSEVLNFVEERPYVDFVTCFKMHHVILRNGAAHITEKRDVEEAVPSTARSLLVSYYNEITKVAHLISSPATCEC